MVPLLVSWDAPSLIRPAEATIRATTQSGAQPPGGNYVDGCLQKPVFERVCRRVGFAARIDLAVKIGDVPFDGAHAEH